MKKPRMSVQEMKDWYEWMSGKKVTDEEAAEIRNNVMNLYLLLERLKAKPKQDLNSEVYEYQLVDE